MTVQQAARDTGLEISLQDIINSVEEEILVIDSEYRLRFANPAALSRLRKAGEQPIGNFCYKVVHGRDTPCTTPLWDCPLRKTLERGGMMTLIHPVGTPDADSGQRASVQVELQRP